ncbi:MAG: hypothetical protein HW405_967 [Candidatus Berkelbacteria bacterium]|nr:hypothetical protein [Candidatus Berkelbacteria bacterium]
MENQQPKSTGIWKVLLIVVIVLVFIFGAYFGLAAILRKANEGAGSTTNSTTLTQKGGKFDQNLVGTWTSDCLVPDANSPWSEKHQFVINANSTAVHTRWSSSGHDCSVETTMTDNYTLTIIKQSASGDLGQINLLDTAKSVTYYDVYQITGNTLEFGHGFRNNLTYDSKMGGSESDRISSLNKYIIYKK